MEDPRVLVAVVAVLLYALVSRRLDKWWISMPMAMVVIGLIVGAGGLGWIGMEPKSSVVRTIAEITLALMLFHDAVRIDLVALRRGYRIPLRLLGIGLPVMILVGTAAALGIMPGLGLIGAALLATMLAPTDAALGESVVSDTRLPMAIRQGLNVESGLNDGLSVPIFVVLLALAGDPTGLESKAFLMELARQVGFGVLGGVLVGGIGGLLFREAAKRGLIGGPWRAIAVFAAALGCFVSAAAMGGSGFIGAFAGGVLFGLVSGARSAEDNAFTGTLGTFFDALSFLLVGAMLLPLAVTEATWRMVVYAVLSLVLLRVVSVIVAMLGSGARAPTQAFMGWFGPRGLASVVFTILLIDAGVPNGNVIAATVVICIVLSVVAHGLSAPPLVAMYSRWWQRTEGGAPDSMEGVSVHEHAVRRSASGSS